MTVDFTLHEQTETKTYEVRTAFIWVLTNIYSPISDLYKNKLKLQMTQFWLDSVNMICLQCFDAVGQQEGHPACKKTEWWGAGVVICLEQGADLHMAQLMPLSLIISCFTKI